MSRIAIIADIHGNLPALEAVLDDIARQRVDEVLVNGDLVGRGPQGNAVVHRIRELGFPCTRGNHEDYALAFRREDVPAQWLTSPDWAFARAVAAELDDTAVRYIDALQMTLAAESQPQVRLFHGSPASYTEGIGRWTSDDTITAHLSQIDEQLLVVSHTHRPLVWRGEAGVVVNTGSVGMPFNADVRAQYAILSGDGAQFEVEHRYVPYDRDLVLIQFDHFIAADNPTSILLQHELRVARPFLVPFLKWTTATNRTPTTDQIPAFLDVYDPEESMSAFAKRGGL